MASRLDLPFMKLTLRRFSAALLLAIPSCAGTAPPPPPVPRVVLVHGIFENGRSYKYMRKHLEKRGFTCYVPKMVPSDGRGGLENLATNLKEDIDAHFGTNEPINIVAFSMGGLVSRYYLQNLGGATRCKQLITISSPHHGTKAGWIYPSKGAEQMRPGSQFLTDLKTTEGNLGKMPVASYRTPMDLIILPPTSSVWERAENIEYPVILHPLMVTSNRVIDDITRRLEK
jgi:triacylglycerol lipase